MNIHACFHLDRGDFVLDVDLDIPAQGVSVLFGPSGCGKTTILRCLAGLERITAGYLRFNGDIWQDAQRFVPVHQRSIGYVFQEASLFPHLTVEHNLLYGFKRIAPEQRRVELDEVVDLLNLGRLLARFPDALSGGQRQRVSIGRALLTSPKLLLMDEPMASLDLASKAEILPYLQRLRDELAIPIVYISHSLSEVTQLADYMILLQAGRVVAQQPLSTLLHRTDLPLAHSEQASTVLKCRVVEQHDQDCLTELALSGGRLWVPRQNTAIGASVRVRILARDVSVALVEPTSGSVLNTLMTQIVAISADPDPGYCLLQLSIGEQTLLARISQRACRQLALEPGGQVWAVISRVVV